MTLTTALIVTLLSMPATDPAAQKAVEAAWVPLSTTPQGQAVLQQMREEEEAIDKRLGTPDQWLERFKKEAGK